MNTVLVRFKNQSTQWREQNTMYNYRGRANIYARLSSRFGVDAVKRHRSIIRKILDNAEGYCQLDW